MNEKIYSSFQKFVIQNGSFKSPMRDGIIEIGVRKDNLKLTFNYCLTTPSSSKKS